MSTNLHDDHARVGLLIGAGFSADLGMPLVRQLTQELLACVHGIDHLEKVYSKSMRGVLGVKLQELIIEKGLNYEQAVKWFEDAVDDDTLGADQETRAAMYAPTRMWMADMVSYVIGRRHVNQGILQRRAVKLYSGIKRLIAANRPLWIFSLNHDLCVEMIAADIGIQPASLRPWVVAAMGPEGGNWARQDPPAVLLRIPEDDLVSQRHCVTEGTEGINHVRLHGAINEFVERNPAGEKFLYRVASRVQSQKGWADVAEMVEALGRDRDDQACRLGRVLVASPTGFLELTRTVLSGGHKLAVSGRLFEPPIAPIETSGPLENQIAGSTKVLMPYRPAPRDEPRDERPRPDLAHRQFELFERGLEELTQLLVIGYSFGDDHVNQRIRHWLLGGPNRKVICVNPSMASCPECVGDLVEKIEVRSMGAVDVLAGPGNSKLSHRLRRWWTARAPRLDAELRAAFEAEYGAGNRDNAIPRPGNPGNR